MALDTHPTLQYVLAFIFFHLGLLANFFVAAHLGMSSKNNSVKTLKDYLALRWMPLVVRWITCIGSFLLLWHGIDSLIDAKFGDVLSVHLGAAIFVGFGIDEITSKGLALLGIQKELPAVPDANQNIT